jgi:hypothetical protein
MKEYKKVEPVGLVEDLNPTQEAIAMVCDELKEFLINKNKAYGNSALSPLRILSKSDTEEQLNVRIDDKLSRLMRGTAYDGDNDIDDLVGYLILKKVYRKLNG